MYEFLWIQKVLSKLLTDWQKKHDVTGHISDEFTRNISKELSCKVITTDKKPCAGYTMTGSKQKNVPNVSMHEPCGKNLGVFSWIYDH